MIAADPRHQPMGVGVDGSLPAQPGLRWALAEADDRGCPLHLVPAR